MQYNYVDWDIRKKPYPSLMKAIELFKSINGKVIVEVGSMRKVADHDIHDYSHECCMEGHSSMLFALSSDEFHTLDIDLPTSRTTFNSLRVLTPKSIYEIVADYSDIVTILVNEGENIDHDSPVALLGVESASSEAESKLNKQHIILIDDTDINWTQARGFHNDEESMGGKGAVVIPHLISKGYEVVFKGRQTCLIKR